MITGSGDRLSDCAGPCPDGDPQDYICRHYRDGQSGPVRCKIDYSIQTPTGVWGAYYTFSVRPIPLTEQAKEKVKTPDLFLRSFQEADAWCRAQLTIHAQRNNSSNPWLRKVTVYEGDFKIVHSGNPDNNPAVLKTVFLTSSPA